MLHAYRIYTYYGSLPSILSSVCKTYSELSLKWTQTATSKYGRHALLSFLNWTTNYKAG